MQKLMTTLSTLFLATLLSACTINYHTEPALPPSDFVEISDAVASEEGPMPLLDETKSACLLRNTSEFDEVKEVTRDSYREQKDVVGYIKDLEAQQKLFLKAKQRYDGCKN